MTSGKVFIRGRTTSARRLFGLVGLAFLTTCVHAENTEWQLYKPSNTGIPGGVVQFCKLDPENNLWVGAFDPFWQEGGIAMFDRVKWTTYSNLDSPLHTHRVWTMDFLSDGTTWLGTDAGVVRFDRFTGEDWSIYTRTNSPLPGNEVRSIDLDAQGRLWMAYWQPQTAIEGVAVFDGAQWQTWSVGEIGFVNVVLDDVAVDLDGNVWVGTRYNGGIAKYDGSTWTVYEDDWPALQVVLGADGHIWADWHGLKMYDGSNWIPMPEPPYDPDISVISVLADGTYWIGSYQGYISYYNGIGWVTHEYAVGAHVYSIEVDLAEEIWVAGNAHLKKLDDSNTFMTYNNRNTGLTEYVINDFAFDAAGNTWFATSGGGLCAFDGEVWRGFNPDNDGFEPWPFQSDSGDQVDVASDGSVWANVFVAIGRWDGGGWTTHLPQYWVEETTVDPFGNVWAAPYNGGVGRYDGNAWEEIASPAYYDPTFIESDASGRIWMGVTGGLMMYDGVEWTTFTTANSGLPDPTVYDIAFHPDGSAWIGTYDGLARFDGIDWTVYRMGNSGLRVNTVLSVAIRDDGLIAAGAFRFDIWPYIGGLSTLDGQEWTTYTVENSPLQHEQIEALEFDPQGRLWVSSVTEGVARVTFLDPADVPDMTATGSALQLRAGPSPFHDAAWVRFRLPESGPVRLRLFDVQGRLVATPVDRVLSAGEQSLRIGGRSLPSGVYLYRLDAGPFSESGRLTRIH